MCSIPGCCGWQFMEALCWSHFFEFHDSVTEVTGRGLDSTLVGA